MKLYRKRLARRVIALSFLFIFLQSFLAPYYGLALTHGPHQPEYTSYDEPGATDLVNLVTGDFAFNLPILDVPGPEGGFSVPLTYNAGIGLDQQASWVGLGWNINVGAVVRNINEYPDDANGEARSVTVQDLVGTYGWASNLGILQLGWNNQTGHYGSVSLLSIVDVSWDRHGVSSVGVAGVNFSGEGVDFDPVKFTMAFISVATIGAGAAATTVASSVATSFATDVAVGLVIGGIVGSSTPGVGAGGYWQYSKQEKSSYLLPVYLRGIIPFGWFAKKKKYKITLNQTRSENMYGIMYLDKYPETNYVTNLAFALSVQNGTNTTPFTPKIFLRSTSSLNQGSASDVNYINDENAAYHLSKPGAFLAEDSYSVKAPGISGSISPYRLEVGSVSMPREMTNNHVRIAPVKYMDYKVPFIYLGSLGNNYFQHVGGATEISNPSFHYGITHQADTVANVLTFLLGDVALSNQRIRSDVTLMKRIPQGNFVEWMSNAEILNSVTYPSGFMDFLSGGTGSTVVSGSPRDNLRRSFNFGSTSSFAYTNALSNTALPLQSNHSLNLMNLISVNNTRVDVLISTYSTAENRDLGTTDQLTQFNNLLVTSKDLTNNTIGIAGLYLYPDLNGAMADVEIVIKASSKPASSIGGYSITGGNGSTYHFALPSYEYDNVTEIRDKNFPTTKRSIIKRTPAFANTWLLTAITGPDFIDRNNNGMVDDTDWGYWVKFHYGNYVSDYEWRNPYASNSFVRDPSDKNESYSKGKKQLYYLNSIETRSHVALFVKSQRADGQSITNKTLLKLDEIILLSKETYAKLVSPVASGGYGTEDYHTYDHLVNKVCEASDFTTVARTYMNKNLVKKVVFTHDYSLCPGTLNSSASGKLTLKSLSVAGRSADGSLVSNKIVPDYVFEYNNPNPYYSQNAWDGWGFYSDNGNSSGSSHKTPQVPSSGKEWSLSSILTPQGSRIRINYERDAYSTVSGNSVTDRYSHEFSAASFINNQVVDINQTINFLEGEKVDVQLDYQFTCLEQCGTSYCPYYINQTYTFAATMQNGDAVLTNFTTPVQQCSATSSTANAVNPTVMAGRVLKKEKVGGNLRVSSIIMEDEFGKQIKTRYIYENGVISQEPGYALGNYYPFYNYPDYPQTPVMYGKVTVLNGNLLTDSDYHTSTVYEFVTPSENHYTLVESTLTDSHIGSRQLTIDFRSYLKLNKYEVTDRTSQIGTLRSVKTFNKNSALPVSATTLYYSDAMANHQGMYSTGTLLFERILSGVNYYFRANRTTTLKLPYMLTRTTTTKDGITNESINEAWDFNTGIVTQKLQKSSIGVGVRTISRLAYANYAEMGSKAVNLGFKNMMTQELETQVYKTDAVGVNTGLISATVQTWSKTWPYRYYDATGGSFSTASETDVWKRSAPYVWRGDYSRLKTDGTRNYLATDNFNYTNPTATANPLWQYGGEPTLFNHSSIVLESKNYNGAIYSALKMGANDRYKLAEAYNSRYTEMAFCSGENYSSSIPAIEGEVKLGNGTVQHLSKGQTSTVHTGDAVVALSSTSGKAFVYEASLQQGKRYKASVWTNNINGRLYVDNTLSAAPVESMKVGNWYLLNFEFVGTSALTEVGVKTINGTVLFDDFRLQPTEAVMTCYVQMPLTYEYDGVGPRYEYILDNDNLYTKYEYNTKGELVKVYRESLEFGEKLVSETKVNYRRFNTN